MKIYMGIVIASSITFILFSGCTTKNKINPDEPVKIVIPPGSVKIIAPDGSAEIVLDRKAWIYVRSMKELKDNNEKIKCVFIDLAGGNDRNKLVALRNARTDVARIGGNSYDSKEVKRSKSFQRGFFRWQTGVVHQVELRAYLCLLPSVDR